MEEEEKAAAIAFHEVHPLEGYRRLTYMMMDAEAAVLSPASAYRILRDTGSAGAQPARDNRQELIKTMSGAWKAVPFTPPLK